MLIKKRFGPRNFVQHLKLKNNYKVGPTPKPKQQVYNVGYDPYVSNQTKMDYLALQHQRANDSQRHYGYNTENRRGGFYTNAKPIPPVATSMDKLAVDWSRNTTQQFSESSRRAEERERQRQAQVRLAQAVERYRLGQINRRQLEVQRQAARVIQQVVRDRQDRRNEAARNIQIAVLNRQNRLQARGARFAEAQARQQARQQASGNIQRAFRGFMGRQALKRLRVRQAALGGGNADAYAEYLLQEIRRNPDLANDILTPNKQTFNDRFYEMFEAENRIDPNIPRDSAEYFQARMNYAQQVIQAAREAAAQKGFQFN